MKTKLTLTFLDVIENYNNNVLNSAIKQISNLIAQVDCTSYEISSETFFDREDKFKLLNYVSEIENDLDKLNALIREMKNKTLKAGR